MRDRDGVLATNVICSSTVERHMAPKKQRIYNSKKGYEAKYIFCFSSSLVSSHKAWEMDFTENGQFCDCIGKDTLTLSFC